jgi:tyrosyl-tRNA synthetase
MNPLVPGLQGSKMSSSDPSMSLFTSSPGSSLLTQSTDSKIDLLDTAEAISQKIKKAEATPKVVEGNGVLTFVEYVLLPAAALKGRKEFVVEQKEGEPLVYTNIKQMQEDYKNDVVRSFKPFTLQAY